MNLQNDDDASKQPRKRSQPLRILSAGDLYNINEMVTGYTPFVRDQQLLRSAVQRPYLILFGEAQFPTLLEKAAAMLHSIAAHHLFADGNKRTAIKATAMFLEANGLEVRWDDDTAADLALRVARGEVEMDAIVAWLQENTEVQDEQIAND